MVFSVYSFQTWFDIAIIAEEGADEAIVEAEQRKNILSMLHQVLATLGFNLSIFNF